jgi:hypothetical protein
MSPGFVVDIAGLLPRRTGNPGAVDEQVYRDILELRCGVPDTFGIGYVHCNDIEHAPCVFAPSIGAYLRRPGCGTRQIRAIRRPSIDWKIRSRAHDWLPYAVLPHGFAEPRRFVRSCWVWESGSALARLVIVRSAGAVPSTIAGGPQEGEGSEQTDVPFALGLPLDNLGGNAAEPDIVIRPIPWGLGDGGEESIRLSGFIVGFAPGT